jgi:hypothetical protein
MDKKLEKKYKDAIKLMRQLGMDDYEIEDKLFQMDDLKGWYPITLKELLEMGEDELNKLKSYCWKEGRYRCDTIGISDLKIEKRQSGNREYWSVSYSDGNGDPHFEVHDENEPINKIGDGYWDYGLFIKE